MSKIKKVGVISLGCAKNRVDCEVMMQNLADAGYEFCNDESVCDAVIINTCTFIEPAKQEAIENILQMAQYKGQNLKKLIVTGCLAERYKEEILNEIPEVDGVLGVKSFDEICNCLESDKPFQLFKPLSSPSPEGNRVLTTENYSVYLKIAEGCSNRCTYCIIPVIRGDFMPREHEKIVKEAKSLAENGAKEINIIAQDITRHPQLIQIVKNICNIKSVEWVRLLYLYPDEITDELIELIATEPKVVHYIDIPLQHASNPVLKRMNRRGNSLEYSKLISKLRKKIPDMSIRTTFITGFPGETAKDFDNLYNFIRKIKFNNMGVFTYSKEESTKAAKFCGQIPERTKKRRAEKLMELQYGILNDLNEKYLGKTFKVLCEGIDNEYYIGRTYFQAPEVDGKIYFTSDKTCKEGEFYNVILEKYDCYDFYGKEI